MDGEGQGPSGTKRKRSDDEESDPSEQKKQKTTNAKVRCPVCLGRMVEDDLIATACAHLFHSQCILQSYEYSDKCPVCRHRIEELGGYRFCGPSRAESEDDPFTPLLVPSTSRRTGEQRTNRRRRRTRERTPYPRGNNDQQATQGIGTEVENTMSAICNAATAPAMTSAREAEHQDTTYQVEYTPDGSSSEDNGEGNDGDLDTEQSVMVPDYVPPVCCSCAAEIMSVSSDNTDDEEEEDTQLCQTCRAIQEAMTVLESGTAVGTNPTNFTPQAIDEQAQGSVSSSSAEAMASATAHVEDPSHISPSDEPSDAVPSGDSSGADSSNDTEDPSHDSPARESSDALPSEDSSDADQPATAATEHASCLTEDDSADDSSEVSSVTSRYMINESPDAPQTDESSSESAGENSEEELPS